MLRGRATVLAPRILLLLVVLGVLQEPAAGTEFSDRVRLLHQKLQLLDSLLMRARAHPALSADDRTILDVAETLTHVARQDLREADLDTVNMSLNEALRLTGEVSRQYAVRAPGADRSEYEDLRATVDALYESFALTVTTSNTGVSSGVDTKAVEADLSRSAELAARGRYSDASRTLRKVYSPLVTALSALRANETVAHRLHFETPKDELDYELSRLQSNKLLLRLMIQERTPASSVLTQLQADVAEADRFKAQSTEQAASDDLEGALRSAEAANGHMVRALRRTGVYIAQ